MILNIKITSKLPSLYSWNSEVKGYRKNQLGRSACRHSIKWYAVYSSYFIQSQLVPYTEEIAALFNAICN
jgi:hypothetical protein